MEWNKYFYLSISIFYYFILSIHYILEAYIVLLDNYISFYNFRY